MTDLLQEEFFYEVSKKTDTPANHGIQIVGIWWVSGRRWHYVTEGEATIVTGGTPVNPKTAASGEVSAEKISGGVPRRLTKGDVLVVPAGVPHWFTEVDGAFLYFLVKVTK